MNYKAMQKIFNLLAITSIFAISAFAQSFTNGYIPQRWIPISIEGKPVKNTKAFIEFSEKGARLLGNAGCNRLFGKFAIKGKSLKFSEIGTTKMFCTEGNTMRTERAFLNVLNKTTSFKKNGNMLKLYGGKRLIAKLELVSPADRVDENENNTIKLEDRKWVLESVQNTVIPELKAAAFIVFNEQKQSAGGNTSCNVFGANYEKDGNKLKITQGIQTFRACVEDERMNIEKSFMDGLQNTDRYEIKNEKLFLYRGRELLLILRAEIKE